MDALPEKQRIRTALQKGKIRLQGQFLMGSNYTFLGELVHEDQVLKVVYKPTRGERPLWDFPDGTLAKREAAAYEISEALGWELVPPTVLRRSGPFGRGSAQLYIEHDPEYHYFKFSADDRQRLQPAAVFDILINNADRKGSHVLRAKDGHLWLIDHGVCFHVEPKLRTVIWDFAGQVIPAELVDGARRLLESLDAPDGLQSVLRSLLRASEINALRRRAQDLMDHPIFPSPAGRQAFPWPPV